MLERFIETILHYTRPCTKYLGWTRKTVTTENPIMSKKFYRPEIDGLRALAIIPVVLFHAGVVGFSGGFVGVDIFFVISGYLITSVILRDIAQHTFSLRTFYARRIRRLLPALFVFLTVTTIFAYLFLKYPGDLESYGASLFAQSLFLSNFYFSGLGDYFGTPVEVLPLLHTWSLSLEEQFYFIFPFLLFFFYKYKRHILKPLLYTLIILSLLYCIYLTNFSPTSPFSPPLLPDLWRGASNLTSAFFLLPTRLWELLLGAVLALPTLRITHIPLAQVLGGVELSWSWLLFSSLTVTRFFLDTPPYFPRLAQHSLFSPALSILHSLLVPLRHALWYGSDLFPIPYIFGIGRSSCLQRH